MSVLNRLHANPLAKALSRANLQQGRLAGAQMHLSLHSSMLLCTATSSLNVFSRATLSLMHSPPDDLYAQYIKGVSHLSASCTLGENSARNCAA